MQINPMKENINKYKTRFDILTAALLRIQVCGQRSSKKSIAFRFKG